jgi:hypothetical protein
VPAAPVAQRTAVARTVALRAAPTVEKVTRAPARPAATTPAPAGPDPSPAVTPRPDALRAPAYWFAMPAAAAASAPASTGRTSGELIAIVFLIAGLTLAAGAAVAALIGVGRPRRVAATAAPGRKPRPPRAGAVLAPRRNGGNESTDAWCAPPAARAPEPPPPAPDGPWRPPEPTAPGDD